MQLEACRLLEQLELKQMPCATFALTICMRTAQKVPIQSRKVIFCFRCKIGRFKVARLISGFFSRYLSHQQKSATRPNGTGYRY